jgi:hypothetical protein
MDKIELTVTDDERRVAVAQVMRLAGLPVTDCFSELS